jgi:hypothetical protein
MIAWFTLSEMKRRKNKLLKILACSRYLNFWQHVPSNSSLLIQPKAILRTLSRITFLEGLHSLLVFPWQKKEQASENPSMFQVSQFLATCTFKLISAHSAKGNSQNSIQNTLPGGASFTISLPMARVHFDDLMEKGT